jgi:cell division septation protein DedD
MRRLRLFAALSVLTSAAFFPALFPTPASAALPTLYTLGEYNAAVSAAQAAVANATAEVATAQAAVDASAVYHETSTVTGQVNVVVNGTFNDASAWSNIGMGDNSTILNSNIARVYNGVLIGSYDYNQFMLQTGTFPSPTRQVTFTYDMSNNNFNDGARPQADMYRVEFRTYSANNTRLNYYDTRNRSDTFGWTNFTNTYNLPDDAVRWDIGFRLADSGYWNGNFAGSIDNVSLTTNATTVTPAYTTYDQSLVAVLNQKISALTAAQAALAAIPPLAINAPSQLVASMDTSTVTLSWAAPTTNLIPERYAISWTDGTGGWGIATGNAGDANALNTSITIDKAIIGSTGGWDKNYTFKIRSDHDSGSMYSAWSNEAVLFITNPAPTPEPSTSPVPSPEPSPTQTPEAPTPSPSPTNTSPSPEPSTTPSPEPSVEPSPEPSVPPAPTPQPSPEPSPEPTPVPSPTPTPSPTPVEPTPVSSPEPQPVPSPEPGPVPSVEPTPQPVPVEPALPVVPQPEPSNPTPEPEPTPVSPEPTPTDPPIEEPEPPIEPLPPAVEPEEPPAEPEEPQEPSTPVEPEPEPVLPEPEPENPSTEPSQPPVEEPAPEPTPEPEAEPSTEAEEVASAVEDVLSDGKLSAADSEAVMGALNADGEVTAEEVSALSEALSEDGKLTTAEKELVATALIESVAPGETLTKEQIQDAGIAYQDLPAETPVEVRQDENGNEVIITADVAAALVLLENPSELIGAVFSDPGEALQALGSIGADMSTEEREEATDMVVATVVAAGAAMNAVGAAASSTGGSTGGSSSGGGSSGGGGASGQSGYRRKP